MADVEDNVPGPTIHESDSEEEVHPNSSSYMIAKME